MARPQGGLSFPGWPLGSFTPSGLGWCVPGRGLNVFQWPSSSPSHCWPDCSKARTGTQRLMVTRQSRAVVSACHYFLAVGDTQIPLLDSGWWKSLSCAVPHWGAPHPPPSHRCTGASTANVYTSCYSYLVRSLCIYTFTCLEVCVQGKFPAVFSRNGGCAGVILRNCPVSLQRAAPSASLLATCKCYTQSAHSDPG